jgi:hypothetical protein
LRLKQKNQNLHQNQLLLNSGESRDTYLGFSPDSANDPVNITIKVPRKSRQYWTSQCKLKGLTMTEVLVKALEERFGEPDFKNPELFLLLDCPIVKLWSDAENMISNT